MNYLLILSQGTSRNGRQTGNARRKRIASRWRFISCDTYVLLHIKYLIIMPVANYITYNFVIFITCIA